MFVRQDETKRKAIQPVERVHGGQAAGGHQWRPSMLTLTEVARADEGPRPDNTVSDY